LLLFLVYRVLMLSIIILCPVRGQSAAKVHALLFPMSPAPLWI